MTTVMKKYALSSAEYILALVLLVFTPLWVSPLRGFFSALQYGSYVDVFSDLTVCLLWFIQIKLLVKWSIKNGTISAVEEPDSKELLPAKRVVLIGLAIVVCILLVSFETGFEVKPFYDIAHRTESRTIVNRLGILARELTVSYWILFILRLADSVGKDVAETRKHSKVCYWAVYMGLLAVFAIFDVFTIPGVTYLSYILFYLFFGLVYHMVNKSLHKTFWLILLLYVL